ncbi:MAG TPA: hypothetical protein VF472_23735 [Burkholderiaceae bacterium]
MNINGQGISLLQQLLANEEIEASNLPKQNTANAKRPHGSHHHGDQYGLDDKTAGPDLIIKALQRQKAHPFKSKSGGRKRGSIEHPEAATSSSELEELLMMEEERNADKPYPIIRPSPRAKDQRGGQQSGADSRLPSAGTIVTAEPSVPGKPLPKLAGPDGKANYSWLEGALSDIRSAAATSKSSDSLVPQVLKIMSDYLDLPADVANAPRTLKAVRERLLALPHQAAGANLPSARNMPFFMPLLLLNAARPRTGEQRGIGKAVIDSLLRRYSM